MRVIRRQRCTGCQVVKPHTIRNFYVCRTGKHGLRIRCIQCVRKDIYENRELKALYYRAYYRRRNRDAARRAQIAAWKKTPAGKQSTRLSNRIYQTFKAMEVRV